MKQRYVGFGVLIVAVSLVACGGGGGGGGGGGVGPPPPPPPTPQSAVYTGNENIATVYHNYPPNNGDPNVTPYPNTDVTYGLSDDVSTTTGSGTVTSTESVTESNKTLNESLTTQVTPSPNGAVTNITVTREVYTDTDGTSDVTTYATPLVVDQNPENNAATWSNGAGKQSNETYSDGTNIARTTNADGSYSETEVDSHTGVNNTATVNSDSSSSWSAAAGSFGLGFGCVTSYTTTAPSGGNITFTVNFLAACGRGTNQIFTVPQWFSTSPLTLASNDSTITTGVSFPGSCSVPAAYGTTGNDIHNVVTGLDPLFGFTETTTTDAYTSSTYGLVCVRSTDVVDAFYNWNLDEYYLLNLNSAPTIVTTTTQTLTLQSGNGIAVASKDRRGAQSVTAAGSGAASSAEAIAVARSIVRAEQIRLRMLTKKRVLNILMHRVNRGGV